MTGENIATLMGNQGVFGGNAYLNTDAAMSNNYMQGMSLAAQILAQQQASQASGMGGQGAMQGAPGGSIF